LSTSDRARRTGNNSTDYKTRSGGYRERRRISSEGTKKKKILHDNAAKEVQKIERDRKGPLIHLSLRDRLRREKAQGKKEGKKMYGL